MIEATDVGVDIGGQALLQGVSLRLRPGQLLAIAGRNGAGKSTLLSVLAGLRAPTRGRVCLQGRALTSLRPVELARRRAVLHQRDPLSTPLLAREVVALGRYPHGDASPHGEAVQRALALTETTHLADRPVQQLSGGERQRVQLARVLAQLDSDEGQLLLLDEPTSALDLALKHSMLRTVRALAREHELAVIAVLHDLNLAATIADRLLVLRSGRVVATGAPEEILNTQTLSHAFGVTAHVLSHPDHGRPQILVAAPELL